MPISVPISETRREDEGPGETNMLMAAATMHELGRLVPTPKERPTVEAEEAAKAAMEIGEWGKGYSAEGRRLSTEVERVPELKGPIESRQFDTQEHKIATEQLDWHARAMSPLAKAAGVDDIDRATLSAMSAPRKRRR